MKGVRIKHWVQVSEEEGHFELTGMCKVHQAQTVLAMYKGRRAEIVDNDEVY